MIVALNCKEVYAMKQFLVVVDMQNDFITDALGTAEAREIVEKAAKKIRNFPGDILVTLDTHGPDYLDTAEGKKLPVTHCVRGTNGWELNPAIAKALNGKSVTMIEKPTFGSTALPGIIEAAAAGEDFSIALIGLCTDICVVSNALLLKAFFPEKEISVDASCCAGVTPELHHAALETMRSCQIDVEGIPSKTVSL